ncbi:hypothetical protein [Chryseobacterium koreense]
MSEDCFSAAQRYEIVDKTVSHPAILLMHILQLFVIGKQTEMLQGYDFNRHVYMI